MTTQTLEALVSLADALACDDNGTDELMQFGHLPWHIADAALATYYGEET